MAIRLVIYVEGGLIQAIHADLPDEVRAVIVDRDNMKADENAGPYQDFIYPFNDEVMNDYNDGTE